MKQQENKMMKALLKKEQSIANGASILVEKTNDWQTIKKYLSNRSEDIQLTKPQQKKLERYQFVYNQLSSGKFVEREVVNQLTKVYNISLEVAIEDLADSKELFGFLFSINKMFELKLQLDFNRQMLEKAKAANDFRAYAALEKNRNEMLKLIPEVIDTPGEYFEPHTNEIVFDPSLIGAPDVNMKEVLEIINKRHGSAIDLDSIPEAEVINEKK